MPILDGSVNCLVAEPHGLNVDAAIRVERHQQLCACQYNRLDLRGTQFEMHFTLLVLAGAQPGDIVGARGEYALSILCRCEVGPQLNDVTHVAPPRRSLPSTGITTPYDNFNRGVSDSINAPLSASIEHPCC